MFKIYIIDVTFLPVTCLIHSARSQDKEKDSHATGQTSVYAEEHYLSSLFHSL